MSTVYIKNEKQELKYFNECDIFLDVDAMFGFISGYEINTFKNLFNLEYKEESFKKNIYCRTMKYFNCEENSIVDLNNLSSFRFGTVYFDQKINISFFIICRKSDLENVIYDFKYLIKNGLNCYYIYKNNINAMCNSSFVSTILKELESKYSDFKIFFEVYKIKDYFHTKSLNTLISRLNQIIDLNILNDFAIDFCFSIFGKSNEETFMIKNNIYKTKFINKYFCNADFKYCNYKKNFYFFDVKYNLISLVCGLFKVDFYNSFVNNYISPKERNVIVLYLSLSLISKFFNFNINDENNTIREYLNDYIKVLDDLNYSDIGKISLQIEFSINVKNIFDVIVVLYTLVCDDLICSEIKTVIYDRYKRYLSNFISDARLISSLIKIKFNSNFTKKILENFEIFKYDSKYYKEFLNNNSCFNIKLSFLIHLIMTEYWFREFFIKGYKCITPFSSEYKMIYTHTFEYIHYNKETMRCLFSSKESLNDTLRVLKLIMTKCRNFKSFHEKGLTHLEYLEIFLDFDNLLE